MAGVRFKRGNKAFIDSLPIVDGQLIFNTETGEMYEDVGNKRIPTGPAYTLPVDTELSLTSTNPVENQTVTKALEGKEKKSGEWEFIFDITTATKAVFVRDKFEDGTPFRFSAFILSVKGVEGDRGNWAVEMQGSNIIAIFYDVNRDGPYLTMAGIPYANKIPLAVAMCGTSYNNSADLGGYNYYKNILSQGKVNRFKSMAEVSAGTRVMLWAVRA